jgi:hypothetical protein
MLPVGTPASWCPWRYATASASRSWPAVAGDAALMIAGFASGVLPVLVVGHRAFDREHAAVGIGDNQIEGWAVLAAESCSVISPRRPATGASGLVMTVDLAISATTT